MSGRYDPISQRPVSKSVSIHTDVGASALEVLRGDEAPDAKVAGVVDAQLGPQCLGLLEVLLLLGGLEVDLDRGVDASRDHPGPEAPRGPGGDPAGEDQRHLVRPAEVEVLPDGLLEPCPPGAGTVKDPGVGELDLAEGELVEEPRRSVSSREGGRETMAPALEQVAH